MPDHSIDFPLTAQEARHSMSRWLAGDTDGASMTLVAWMDHCFWIYMANLEAGDAYKIWMVFKGTFERSLAEHIAGVNHG